MKCMPEPIKIDLTTLPDVATTNGRLTSAAERTAHPVSLAFRSSGAKTKRGAATAAQTVARPPPIRSGRQPTPTSTPGEGETSQYQPHRNEILWMEEADKAHLDRRQTRKEDQRERLPSASASTRCPDQGDGAGHQHEPVCVPNPHRRRGRCGEHGPSKHCDKCGGAVMSQLRLTRECNNMADSGQGRQSARQQWIQRGHENGGPCDGREVSSRIGEYEQAKRPWAIDHVLYADSATSFSVGPPRSHATPKNDAVAASHR